MEPAQRGRYIHVERLPFQQCPQCGCKLLRTHRKWWEKIFWVAAMRCSSCEHRLLVSSRDLQFAGGSWVRCPKCGTTQVTRIRDADVVDPMHAHWRNTVRRLLKGKLYHCRFCRIQFYDLRKRVLPGSPPGPDNRARGASAGS